MSTHTIVLGKPTLEDEIAQAEYKAIDALARSSYLQFGYWASIWIHLNRISGGGRPNPFAALVTKAREMRAS